LPDFHPFSKNLKSVDLRNVVMITRLSPVQHEMKSVDPQKISITRFSPVDQDKKAVDQPAGDDKKESIVPGRSWKQPQTTPN
jgi:hypothetical protein